jgi:hypothetical protein
MNLVESSFVMPLLLGESNRLRVFDPESLRKIRERPHSLIFSGSSAKASCGKTKTNSSVIRESSCTLYPSQERHLRGQRKVLVYRVTAADVD